MGIEDLIDVLENSGLLPEEVIEIINNILKDKYNTKAKLKEYAIFHNICPNCGSNLSLHIWKESRGEHFGFSAYEEMLESRCISCGWNDSEE